MWSTCVEVYCLLRSSLFTRALNSFGLKTKFLQGSSNKIWNKFPSNYKPSQFWNANFPPIISPSEYKSLPKIRPSKSSFEKYKPRGLFSEFYGIRKPCGKTVNWTIILTVQKNALHRNRGDNQQKCFMYWDLNEFLSSNEEGGIGIFGFAVLAIF